MTQEQIQVTEIQALRMPAIAIRGLVMFPKMVLHFDVGRPKSVAALEKAMMGDQRIFLVAQMDAEIDEPELSDLCRVGTIAQIKQVLNLPGDSIRVLVEGVRRGVLGTVLEEDPCLIATVRLVREDAAPDTAEMKALVRTTHAFFEEYCNASMRVSQETLRSVMDVDKPDQLADIIAANVLIRLEDRQAILEKLKVKDRLEALCGILVRETELADVEKQVQARIKKQIEKDNVKLQKATVAIAVNDNNLTESKKQQLIDAASKAANIAQEDIVVSSFQQIASDKTPEPEKPVIPVTAPGVGGIDPRILIAGAAAGIFLFLVLLFLILRHRKKKQRKEDQELFGPFEGDAFDLDSDIAERAEERAVENQIADVPVRPQDPVNQVRSFAEDNPEIIASMISTWLKEEKK